MEALTQILAARELRAERQRKLLEQYRKPLLSFTMNIPGPIKWDRDVSIGFFIGCRYLGDALQRLPVLCRQEYREETGAYAFYVVDTDPVRLKQLAVELEAIEPIGRLFDMDVLDPQGQALHREALGHPVRRCLICDQPAALCARSRAHGLDALRDKTGFLLYIAGREELAEYIAAQAFLALQQEVSTTPKPGLVDRNNRGSHKDMTLGHFFASANALRPYFCKCAREGFLTRDLEPKETFFRIRELGKEAEQDMLRATGGVNTHKGAIFSLGLLCAAAGRTDPAAWSAETLLQACAAMGQGIVAADLGHITLENAKTAGEQLYAQYGITGIRGQAEQGFPALWETGLPIFHQALDRGLPPEQAGSIALLHLICAVDDTNLIRRGGRQTQLEVQAKIRALLAREPFPPREVLEELDRAFIEKNLSPGGCADLLSMIYLLQNLL